MSTLFCRIEICEGVHCGKYVDGWPDSVSSFCCAVTSSGSVTTGGLSLWLSGCDPLLRNWLMCAKAVFSFRFIVCPCEYYICKLDLDAVLIGRFFAGSISKRIPVRSVRNLFSILSLLRKVLVKSLFLIYLDCISLKTLLLLITFSTECISRRWSVSSMNFRWSSFSRFISPPMRHIIVIILSTKRICRYWVNLLKIIFRSDIWMRM